MAENKTINDIMSEQLPLAPMSDDDRRRHWAASTCDNCGCHFTRKNFKVRHHDHTTGEYLFAACCNCNLALKPKKCSSNTYLLNVICYNLKNYDSHFIIKEFLSLIHI